MFRSARSKTKKDNTEHEDIWRAVSIEPIATLLRNIRLINNGQLLRKEGRGGYHQDDVKPASARKEKKGEGQEEMAGQYQGGHERVQDDRTRGAESKWVEHENKGRLITTWNRLIGEKNSVKQVPNCSFI